MTKERPLGFWAALLCGTALLQWVAVFVLLSSSPRWYEAVQEDETRWLRLAIGWGTAQLLLFVLSLEVWRRARILKRGNRGRARILLLSAVTAVHAILTTVSVGIVLWAARASIGHVLGGSITSLLFGLTHLAYPDRNLDWVHTLYDATATVQIVTAVVVFSLCVACWLLVADEKRERIWKFADLALLGAFLVVTATLPLSPIEGDDASLLRAVVRMAITTLFGIRLALRSVGPILSALERVGFRSMVAARHLRAKKRGFLAASGTLSVLAVAVSSCMLISVLSVMGGFRADLTKKILGNHAHIVVDRRFDDIEDWQPVLDQTRERDGVSGATPYLQSEVMVSSLSNRAGALLRGIDPSSVTEVTDLGKNMTHGKLDYLDHPENILQGPPTTNGKKTRTLGIFDDPPGADEEGDKETDEDATTNADPDPDPDPNVLPGLVVGQELARTLRLVVGDRVTVVSPRGELGPTGPIPRTRPFRIAGIFYSGMYEYDMKHAYVSLEEAQRFLKAGNAVSGLEIKVADVERAPALAEALSSELGDDTLRIRDWKMMNQQLFGALALEKLAMFITLGIAVLIAGFSVFGTLTLLVQEKRREVGILKAMGTSAPGVVRIFVLEGLLIGAAGGLLGLGLGFVMTFAAEHFGIRMNPEVYYIDKLPVKLDPTEFALVGAATVVVCLAATLFPAYQASRVRPVDALRYD